MDAIQVENLRCIKDSKRVDLKSINLLLGPNSSGKSSLIRCFPLLKQSSESRRTAPLLWWGRLVDYGMFSDALKKDSAQNSISIGYSFCIKTDKSNKHNSSLYANYINRKSKVIGDMHFFVKTTITQDKDKESTRIKKSEIEFCDHTLTIEISKNNEVSSLKLNGEEFISVLPDVEIESGTFIPIIQIKEEDSSSEAIPRFSRTRKLYPPYSIMQSKRSPEFLTQGLAGYKK